MKATLGQQNMEARTYQKRSWCPSRRVIVLFVVIVGFSFIYGSTVSLVSYWHLKEHFSSISEKYEESLGQSIENISFRSLKVTGLFPSSAIFKFKVTSRNTERTEKNEFKEHLWVEVGTSNGSRAIIGWCVNRHRGTVLMSGNTSDIKWCGYNAG